MEFGLAPDQSRKNFDVMQDQASLADSLGYAALWVHEHHSEGMMYPDPLMALAALAPVTSTIKLGTSMLLLPIHHPVRVAQEAAMLDVLSGGRVCLGLANGYAQRDLDTFGVPGSHRGKRMTEGVELIRRLWRGGAVSAKGEGFDLQDFVLFPPPVQVNGPPLYLGGHAEVAIRRAAELGDGYFISATASCEMVGELIRVYRGCLEEANKPLKGAYINRVVCVTKTARQKADAEVFYSKALLRLYDSWGHDNIRGLLAHERTAEHVSQANLIVGEPEECYEKILQYQQLGVEHIACLANFGMPPLDVMEQSIRLLGEKIIPRF